MKKQSVIVISNNKGNAPEGFLFATTYTAEGQAFAGPDIFAENWNDATEFVDKYMKNITIAGKLIE